MIISLRYFITIIKIRVYLCFNDNKMIRFILTLWIDIEVYYHQFLRKMLKKIRRLDFNSYRVFVIFLKN
jgi:hypothetical protein